MPTAKTPDETMEMAKNFAHKISGGRKNVVICLKGNLGTGKTTFVKGFCGYFGIENLTVKSPTYTYYRLYKGDKANIYHFDYYRLEALDDIVEHELFEIIERKDSVVLIEWPEKVEFLLPKGTFIVNFNYGKEKDERLIKFSQI